MTNKQLITEGLAKLTESSRTGHIKRPSRMMAPKQKQFFVRGISTKPIDYGHCNDILVDKYGKERGDKMYEEVFVDSGKNFGWTVCQKILIEKGIMAGQLGYVQSTDNVEYMELYIPWLTLVTVLGEKAQAPKREQRVPTYQDLKQQDFNYFNTIKKSTNEMVEPFIIPQGKEEYTRVTEGKKMKLSTIIEAIEKQTGKKVFLQERVALKENATSKLDKDIQDMGQAIDDKIYHQYTKHQDKPGVSKLFAELAKFYKKLINDDYEEEEIAKEFKSNKFYKSIMDLK